uniref:Reverse transcriptase zinc-binding domain-containing protein n=1 Tax=Aegilops tauschii subsp. strangulata TaxID=200361 RepID=A0A453BKH7_AEGTS
MNKARRLATVKSVLCAIPIYQLLVFTPPIKTIKQLEKIEVGFLWAGREAANGGNCHVNWRRTCRPIELGGLGIPDLERTGLALRLRWLWLSRTDQTRAWSGLGLQFSADEWALFFACTQTVLGNSHTTLFWDDRWINGRAISEIAPQLHACIPKRKRKARTVAEGLHANALARDIEGTLDIQEIGQYIHLWSTLERTTLTEEPDQLLWKWTTSRSYSAKSCYKATFQGSIHSDSWKFIWKSWAPTRVRFFHWLADQDQCWTADRLARRGL